MKIYIDEKEVDVDQTSSVAISLSVASHSDIESGRTGYSRKIVLPMTAGNREVLRDVEQLNGAERFNREEHTARVEKDGFTVFEGVPFLVAAHSVGANGECGEYHISIIGAGKEWVKCAASRPFRAIQIAFNELLSGENIQKSWSWNKPVRFLPVQRDQFEVDNANSNLFLPVRALTFEDYHPFLNVKALMDSIFQEAGYRIESKFLNTPFFNSLYMSGNYPRKSADGLKAQFNFRAGRFDKATAVANLYGRVRTDPYTTINSLGNIVESADASDSSGGEAIEGVFTNGGYFSREGKRVVFAPPREVTLAFEYHLFYATEYYMESRERLLGFNVINLGDGVDREVNIANRNRDRREEMRANRSYKLFIFDHNPSSSYQLWYDEVTNPNADLENLKPSDITARVYGTFSSRTHSVAVMGAKPICNPRVLERKSTGTSYEPYVKDWALYDGYVQERGEVEVEVRLRSQPERILPSRPKYFDAIWFGGAEESMKLTLGSRTTVRPLFSEFPGEGTTVDFEQVAAHEITALDFINGLKQMFNLHFYTDQFAKRVFIDPRRDFYLERPLVDWSDRIDHSKEIVVSELGTDLPRQMNFRYNTGDGAVERWNRTNQARFGEWKAEIENRFASQRETTNINLFAPSINISGSLPDAHSASLIQVGEREYSSVRSEDLNFPPKIVRYLGVLELPQGEYWGWPLGLGRYPFLAFHHPAQKKTEQAEGATALEIEYQSGQAAFNSGFSLCFEDRDQEMGLHRYWDESIEMINDGRRVELSLNLGPEEIEPLITPNVLKRDFRARYLLRIDQEEVICRLEQVVDYDPSHSGSTRCVFVTATKI